MQLNDKATAKNIKATLGVATAALLGLTPAIAQSSENTQVTELASPPSSWNFNTAALLYSEDSRVTALEAVVNASREFDDEHFLSLKFTIDTLTGASANGAVPQAQVQTFTRPSGNGQYKIRAGDTPLDDTFKDTRVQLNASWTQPLQSNLTLSTSGHLSKEFDYLSLGVNSNVALDFNKKNTTASFGVSLFRDTFSPHGDIPIPFSAMLIGDSDMPTWEQEFAQTRSRTKDDKTITDFLFGLTQVINRRMVALLNYSYSNVDGYQTDPFKVLSLINPQGQTQQLLYENRPDERKKHSVFAQTKYHLSNSILDLSYRYMRDNWQIKSHTIDTRLRFNLNDGHFIEPHVRFYDQSAAEFYQPYLNNSEQLPKFASADYRVGKMKTYTLGAKYGMPLESQRKLALRLEYYNQQPENTGFVEPGDLANLDLYEPVHAVIFQMSYSF